MRRRHNQQTRTDTSALGRAAGRGLFVLGVGLTYSSEYEKADKQYRGQNPELSASERQSRVAESAPCEQGHRWRQPQEQELWLVRSSPWEEPLSVWQWVLELR